MKSEPAPEPSIASPSALTAPATDSTPSVPTTTTPPSHTAPKPPATPRTTPSSLPSSTFLPHPPSTPKSESKIPASESSSSGSSSSIGSSASSSASTGHSRSQSYSVGNPSRGIGALWEANHSNSFSQHSVPVVLRPGSVARKAQALNLPLFSPGTTPPKGTQKSSVETKSEPSTDSVSATATPKPGFKLPAFNPEVLPLKKVELMKADQIDSIQALAKRVTPPNLKSRKPQTTLRFQFSKPGAVNENTTQSLGKKS